MKKSLIFFAILFFLSATSSLFAQNVSFRMKRPPLNQLKASDLWSATITNGGEPFTAYLYGSMTNNENGELIVTGQTMTFEVKRGTTNFKISDLPRIPDINYLSRDPKYKESFMNTGGAPAGDYKICVELRKADNSVAGDDCFDQKIMGGDAPQLISPRNEEQIRIPNPVFTWMHMKGPGSTQTYSLKIVELKGNESPENAMLKNKAFFEKEGISQQLFQYPSSADKFEEGKKYAWQVSIGDLKSEVSIFDRWGNLVTGVEDLLYPVDRMKIESDSITFRWKLSNPSDSALGSSIKIVELKGNESPENAMLKNKAFFEKEGIRNQFYSYPPPDRKFEQGKSYAWQVKTGNVVSPVGVFLRGGFIIPLIALRKAEVGSDSVAFSWTVSGPSDSIQGFSITTWQLNNGNRLPTGKRMHKPFVVTKKLDEFEATLYLSPVEPCPCEFEWTVEALNREGKVIAESETGTFKNRDHIDQDAQEKIILSSPANGTTVDSDSLTFSWSRRPPPKDGSWKLKIVELKGSESPENAIAKNKAFFEKEGIREQFFSSPPPDFEGGKEYAWQVSMGNTSSDVFVFACANGKHFPNEPLKISLTSPANGTTVGSDSVTFKWTPPVPTPTNPNEPEYRLRVWQLMDGQNGLTARRSNQPIVEKDLKALQFTTGNLVTGPCKPLYLCDFVWNVQALNREGKVIAESETGTFKNRDHIDQDAQEKIILSSPANGTTVESDSLTFRWRRQPPPKDGSWKIKIVELKSDESPENAIAKNKAFFEKEGIRSEMFFWPLGYTKFEAGKKYAWQISSDSVSSNVGTFSFGGTITNNGTIHDYAGIINNAGIWNGTASKTGGTIILTSTLTNTGTFADGTVITGGTLQTNNGPLTVTGGTIKGETFTLTTLSGNNTYSGNTTINAGILQLSEGSVTITGGTVNANGGALNGETKSDVTVDQLKATVNSSGVVIAMELWNTPINTLLNSSTITNNGTINDKTSTAYLYGSMTNNENGELIAEWQTDPFDVKKGNFKVSDLAKVPDINYISKEKILRTGNAPPGDYKICVELRYINTKTTSKECYDQKITGTTKDK